MLLVEPILVAVAYGKIVVVVIVLFSFVGVVVGVGVGVGTRAGGVVLIIEGVVKVVIV